VLLNLLENAAKYTLEDKHIAVRVRAAGGRVLVEVEDNGIGIGRRDQRRIFERFYRSDDLLARRTEGTGLGLSIARLVVEAHGGRLVVRSQLGKGSTFTIELPAAPELAHARAGTQESPS
jgi:two-component system, OmpR family, phosphate regulon sensor histidine kinase PhoR